MPKSIPRRTAPAKKRDVEVDTMNAQSPRINDLVNAMARDLATAQASPRSRDLGPDGEHFNGCRTFT